MSNFKIQGEPKHPFPLPTSMANAETA